MGKGSKVVAQEGMDTGTGIFSKCGYGDGHCSSLPIEYPLPSLDLSSLLHTHCLPLHIIYASNVGRVNHQIHPWIFMERSNLSLNQLSLWIRQTSIKKVTLSKCSVSHVDLSPCTLCALVHVARRKPRVQGLIWLNWKKFSFHFFSLFIFSAFPIFPLHYPYLLLQISIRNIKNVIDLFPFAPLQNHHHLQRFSMVLCFGLFVICNLKFLTCSSFWTTSIVLLLLDVKPVVIFTRVYLR